MQSFIRPISRNTFIGMTMARRSVVYVRGERVQGAIRDPEDYLTINGHKYGPSEENLQHIKKYMQSTLQNKYPLSDKLLLQILTHKSFAHGTQPYNEKLSQLGEELIRFNTSKFAISQANNSQYSIDNLNFDCLGSLTHKLLSTDRYMAYYAYAKGLDKIFFCKIPTTFLETNPNFKPRAMFATITHSLVGAIATQHGKKAAEEVIENEIIKFVLPKTEEYTNSNK